MLKKFAFLLIGATALLSACNETNFVANTTNELFVGDWVINEVDNADALVSASELMTSFMNEKFIPKAVFTFQKGSDFVLKDASGKELLTGKYAIGAENESLSLQIDGTVYEYEIVSQLEMLEHLVSCGLNSSTPGETVKLNISKR